MPSYRERIPVPWWVWLVSFVGSWALSSVIGWYADASLSLIVGLSTGFALLVVFVFCVLPLLWVYRFDGLYLKLGFREKIDLRWVDQIEVVQPENLKALRRVFRPRQASGKVLPVMVAGPLGLAAGQFMLGGGAILGALGARRRAVCPPWMHGAVLVHNMPAQSADDWLLASSRPEQLAAAIREAVATAQATVVA